MAAGVRGFPVHAQAPLVDSPEIERRVDAMVAKLSLPEKIDLIGGVDNMFIRAAPSAGFPRLKMSDGPEGVRTWGPTTAYAGGIALAATWDPELAERTGESLGDDARARGVHFLLAPGVNIYRAPMNGRNFEYLGEDPYLAARMAVGYIEGVQSRGVVATVKHFAANNSEYDRHNISSDVDERTLREIYLPAFEAAVREAHVGAVMDSYNLVNGVHSTENPLLNLEILKKEWGFDGVLMSDWEATYDGPAAANGGLDLEMPRPAAMNRQNLLPAVASGAVSVSTVDDKIRRIFRTAIRFGFLDRPQLDSSIPLYGQEGRRVALDGARESMVLLKNRDGLLPLDPAKIHTLAVIGPDAWPAVPGGGGSSQVSPYRATSYMTGISDFLGSRVKVLYVRGLPTADEFFQQTEFDHNGAEAAIKVEVFDNAEFRGPAVAAWRMTHADQWRPEMWTPKAVRPQSARLTARYTPKKSGPYLFLVGAGGEDRYVFTVDGRKIVEQPFREGQAPAFADVDLEAGKTVSLQLDYLPYSDHFRAGFGVRPADEMISSDAKRVAASADAVVVCAGFDPQTEREGYDRTFTLPWGQDDLISMVAAANPRTIVTLTSGGGADMRRWIDAVPAVLQTWYPGQEGGTALAEILFGVRSPEGKLPASFERAPEDNPTHDSYYPPTPYSPGTIAHVKYSEGVFLGYRYYTTKGVHPLFPFGFGLSYTSFGFSGLEVPRMAAASAGVEVSFDVANTGSREGAEVAQIYIGDPSALVARPVKELKAFRKVRLRPGENQRVTLDLDRRAFAYFDVVNHAWRVDPGRFVIYVGDSSEAMPLKADIEITP